MSLDSLIEEAEAAQAIEAAKDSAYDRLPASIKAIYTHKEWLWLDDREKVNLLQRETEPDE